MPLIKRFKHDYDVCDFIEDCFLNFQMILVGSIGIMALLLLFPMSAWEELMYYFECKR